MKIIRLINIILISAVISGCVGLVVGYPTTQVAEKFSIIQGKSEYAPKYVSNPTKTEVRNCWGEPHKISSKNGIEAWKYKHGFRWIGFMPIVVFALPLGLPVLPAKTVVYFQDETAIKIHYDYTASFGGFIAPNGYNSVNDPWFGRGYISPDGYHVN